MDRVLFVSRPFLNSVQGTGEQVVAREVYYALIRNGLKVDYVKRIGVSPYKTILSIIFYDYLIPLILALKCIFFRYKLVFFCTPYQAPFLILFRLFGTKSAVLIHDLFFYDYQYRTLFDKYSFLICKNVLKWVNFIVTTSEESQVKIKKLYERDSSVIPLGTGFDFKPIDIDLKRNGNHVGYIGAYVSRKRVHLILDMLKSNNKYGIVFHFAGNIPDDYLKHLEGISLGHSKIEIHGPVSDCLKTVFFNKIQYLYFPTQLEGFGIPLIESFRSGVIPIVHEDANIPRMIKDKCIKVKTPYQVVDKIEYFNSNDDEYYEVLKHNYEYSKKFDYDHFYHWVRRIISD